MSLFVAVIIHQSAPIRSSRQVMRRSLTPTLPCQASHHPTPLLQPGVTPLAPGTPTPLPRTTPIALAHNAEGEIEVLTDDAGVAIGKRFWPPGTKQVDLVAVPNKAGPILGLVERNVLAQLQQFKNGPDAARIKQHLLRTAPSGERYDVAAEDRRIAKQTLDRELLQPTPKGVVEQYARRDRKSVV